MSQIHDWGDLPNPGSKVAVEQFDCTCAVFDNHNGQGIPQGDGKPNAFWITIGCPIHDPIEDDTKQGEIK